jgi:hypothetical protein
LSNTPRPRQKKVRRLRGECLIEGLPTAAEIPLDGLRLRFDVRLDPASAAATELSPLTEPLSPRGAGFTERIAQRAFGVPGVYQRWAVLSGFATLALTLALWFFGAPQPGPASSSTPEPELLEPLSFGGAGSAPSPSATPTNDGVDVAAATSPVASPAVAPTLRIQPPISGPASQGPSSAPKTGAASDPRRQHAARPALAMATGIVETAALARPRMPPKSAASRNVEADLVDLFADTK